MTESTKPSPDAAEAALPPATCSAPKFKIGDRVRKIKGSQWHGTIVGWYSTKLTPEGYAVESYTETGSVQIYPVQALELWEPNRELRDAADK